ncbi:MAG: phosphoribosylglycinamide formyltransferase [Candidatus Omnitrophica bacterium]|nr:phosphoribosylglycinamide formyltransferase [Candidatus Omnitrophota bacterium]MBU0879034.1 phosphoribosylglycinamide formyltransferase [Candidatus Omnitrophota bacterium]MBU0896815.1 phosphoribosylglycinamide formyltransferase [Candidatus Omnitrophota bacterium]MBU1134248.1 phosphoribosylglycinamide formyltransferase [Candidatus Omnitrophota bacterium]MBU1367554.1 phosphoribosylglycinamide formyltransferase [Candidatus Omnitrophota bacterium]
MNIAVLASGRGTNFEAIARAIKKRYVKANLKLLITDKETADVRVRAKKFGIRDIFIDPKQFKSRLEFDKGIVKILRKEKVNLVVLAGFMRVFTPYFVKSFKNKILNIHPTILPAFKGIEGVGRAFKYGCRVTGVTVHFVDEKVDHGPIILQAAVRITEGMSLEELESKVHKLEHKLYPQAVKLFVENKLKVEGRHVKII